MCKGEDVDFRLVHTYVPSFYLTIRCWFVIGLGLVFTSILTPQHAAVALCYVMYSDYVVHAHRVYDSALMHTSVIGLAFFLEIEPPHSTSSHNEVRSCLSTHSIVVAFVVDSVWAALSNIFVINILLTYFYHHNTHSLCFAALLAVHIMTACELQTSIELALRVPIFLTISMLTYYAPAVIKNQPQSEKREDLMREQFTTHTNVMILPFSLHILFVHKLVLIGSVVVLIVIFTKIYFPSAFYLNKAESRVHRTAAVALEGDSLEAELRRAKAQMSF